MRYTYFIRTLYLSVAVCLTVPLLSSCRSDNSGNLEQQVRIAELEAEIGMRDSLLHEIFASLNEITVNLGQIKIRENILFTISERGEYDQTPMTRINADIGEIDRLLLNNRRVIKRLREDAGSLASANVAILSLENVINSLNKQIEESARAAARYREELLYKDEELSSAYRMHDRLSSQLSDMELAADSIGRQLMEKETILSNGYYVAGSRKELIERGYLTKTGMMGRTVRVNADKSLEDFTKVDIRETSFIEINGVKSAEVISLQPSDSYKFVKDERGRTSGIYIMDKDRFWGQNKTLVIATN